MVIVMLRYGVWLTILNFKADLILIINIMLSNTIPQGILTQHAVDEE